MHSKDYGGLFIFYLLFVHAGAAILIAYIGINSPVAGSIHAMRAWVSFNLLGQNRSHYPSLGFILQRKFVFWLPPFPGGM